MKYIDAHKLIANLERQNTDKKVIESLIRIIISLQQEQPKKSQKNCNDCPHCIDRKDQYGWHFKGCFGGPYNGKFIAEIDECPLKQEQPEDSKGKFVFPKFLYARTMDNKTIDVSYAPQDMTAIEYVRNDYVEEQSEVDLNDEIKKFIEEYGYERGEDKLLIAIVARYFFEFGKTARK